MGDIRRVRPGDAILQHLTAQAFNSFAEAAERDGGTPSALIGGDSQAGLVWVRNDSGARRDRFSIVGLGAPVFAASNLTEFQNKPLLAGQTPVVATHWNKPAVLLQSIEPGYIGQALVAGVVPVQIDIQHIAHRWADVQASTTSLKSYATGSVKILSTPTQTGVQWCLVELGKVFKGTLIGKVDSNIAANTSDAISIHKGSDRTDTTYNVTAYTTVALTAAKWVTVEEIEGTWYAFKWEC